MYVCFKSGTAPGTVSFGGVFVFDEEAFEFSVETISILRNGEPPTKMQIPVCLLHSSKLGSKTKCHMPCSQAASSARGLV